MHDVTGTMVAPARRGWPARPGGWRGEPAAVPAKRGGADVANRRPSRPSEPGADAANRASPGPNVYGAAQLCAYAQSLNDSPSEASADGVASLTAPGDRKI